MSVRQGIKVPCLLTFTYEGKCLLPSNERIITYVFPRSFPARGELHIYIIYYEIEILNNNELIIIINNSYAFRTTYYSSYYLFITLARNLRTYMYVPSSVHSFERTNEGTFEGTFVPYYYITCLFIITSFEVIIFRSNNNNKVFRYQ